jgi:polar amino acid transport system permease protein
MEYSPFAQFAGPLLEGLRITLRLTVVGAALGIVCSVVAGLGKRSAFWPWRWLCVTYIEVFRGTSALVQLFWFYFALPFLGIKLNALTAGVLVLGLNMGAYGAEVVRGAIAAVPVGQSEAAAALNFSRTQTLWRIVLPQSILPMLPAMGNLLIELLKNSALASMITLSELTFSAQVLRSDTLQTVPIFTTVLLLYFLVAQIMAFGVRSLERKLAESRGEAPA